MKHQPGVWGIDLGQCALKALRLQMVDGTLTATAFDYVEYPKILSQPDAEPDQLTREALEQFLSRNSLRGDQVAISVPGQAGLARFVKLPPVEEKKIADIVKFEAKQQIPFNLDEVVWDFQKLGAGSVVDGFALETEIGLFAMKRDQINRSLQVFKEIGVEVHVIQMAPLALCNFVAYDLLGKDPGVDEGSDECVVALDIGTDSSNLVITNGGRVIWQRPVPLGGNHFTRALTKELKLTFAKAEHLKRNATKSPPEFKKIMVALKPVFNDFVGEVQRSLGYFNNTHRDAQISYMIGLGNAFRLPVLQKFLGEKLGLEVRKLDKMQRLEGEEVLSAGIYTENILSFAVAYGLALQGLNLGRVTTNLLPGELRTERMIRAKKPWAVAAASLLLVGLGAAAAEGYLAERPYIAPSVKQAIDTSGQVARTADSLRKEFDTVKTNALKEEEAVKAIVAGQQERLNWLKLSRFISDCIPQPDDGEPGKKLPNGELRLPEEIRNRYWVAVPKDPRPMGIKHMSGAEAYKRFVERQTSGKTDVDESPNADTLPPGIDDLIQYNIESIDARFCDDLKAYWGEITKTRQQGDVRPQEHYQKVPEGKGWVVEIQGYTYHHDRDRFIRDTLLNNIARLGIKASPTAPAGGPGGTATPPGGLGATPASGADAKADALKEEEAVKEPILNRISHVLLYEAQSKAVNGPAAFEVIGKSDLDALVRGVPLDASGRPGMPGPGGMSPGSGGMSPGSGGMSPTAPGAVPGMAPGMAGTGGATETPKPTRDSWFPVGTQGAAGPGGMSGPGMSPGSGGGPRSRGTTSPSTGGPGTMGPGGKPLPASAGLHTRTEFVILFIWQEPTPSDALRGEGDSASTGTSGTSGTTSPGSSGTMKPSTLSK